MPIHDLKCELCDEVERDAIVIYERPIEPCHCGGVRHRHYDWSLLDKNTKVAFTPVTYGGTTYSTREEWDSFRNGWEKRFGEPLEVEGNSRALQVASMEDHAQRQIDQIERVWAYRNPDKGEQIKRELTNGYERAIAKLKRGY